MVKKSTPVPVEVINGRTIASGAITHEITLWNSISASTQKRLFSTSSQPLTIPSALVCLG